MPDSKTTQETTYPLPAYNFRVTVAGESASFSEVSGLSIEYETATYRHGLSFREGEALARIRKLGHVAVALKKGRTSGGGFLESWLSAGERNGLAMAISLCSAAGVPTVVWHIKEAIPIKLTAPTFDAGGNQVAIETLEILAYGISVEGL